MPSRRSKKVLNRRGNFTPLSIANCELWLRADKKIYSDSDNTPAASDGTAIYAWGDLSNNGRDFTQSTTDNQPLLKLTTNGINNRPVLLFDGTNDILVNATNFLGGVAGTVFAIGRLSAVPKDFQSIFASEDTGTANYYILFNVFQSTNKIRILQKNNDIVDSVAGDTTINAGTNYGLLWRCDGVAYTMEVNGTNQTLAAATGANNGDWFGDTTLRDNFTIGGGINTSAGQFFKGSLAELILYSRRLSDAEITKLEKYFTRLYGITFA